MAPCMSDLWLVGMEPHSALPLGLPVVFNPYSTDLPDQLRDMHGLASSLVRSCPKRQEGGGSAFECHW